MTRKHVCVAVVIAGLTLFSAAFAGAEDFTLKVPKGQVLIVKIPRKLWMQEKLGASSGQPIYTLEIDSAFMTGKKWEEGDIPSLQEFSLEKTEVCGRMRYDCKVKGFRQVELRSANVWLKLRFGPDVSDVDSAFGEVVSLGTVAEFENSDYFKTKVFAVQVPRVFAGPLAPLPDEIKLRLFQESLNNGAEALSSETYKGKTYLVVRMGEGSDVYNSLRLNQSARTAKLVNEKLLKLLKTFGTALPGSGDLFGMKLEEEIPFKDFTSSDSVQHDHLQIYAPSDSIRKFSDADITSQQFIDGCAVLVNDNRIQVNLTSN